MKKVFKIKLEKCNFEVAKYEGFTLKKGFFYGRNLRGQAMATSGWYCEGNIYVYTRGENGWKGEWWDAEYFEGIEDILQYQDSIEYGA